MRTDQLRADYVHLTAHERFRLLVDARVRDDDEEINALETSAPVGSIVVRDPAYDLRKRAVAAVVADYTRVAGPYLSNLQLLEQLRPMIQATWNVVVNGDKVPKGAGYGDLVAAVRAKPKEEFPFIAMNVAVKKCAFILAGINAGFARVCDELIGVDPGVLLEAYVPDLAEMLAPFADELARSEIDEELAADIHDALERRFLGGGY